MSSSRLPSTRRSSSEREIPTEIQAPRIEEELSPVAREFIGAFFWSSPHSGGLLDFATLELRSDGGYSAQVEATLLNPRVRSFAFPCTLPEEGRWNAYQVSGQTRIRVSPTTGRARVYLATRASDHLSLARRGRRTLLFPADRRSSVLGELDPGAVSGARADVINARSGERADPPRPPDAPGSFT